MKFLWNQLQASECWALLGLLGTKDCWAFSIFTGIRQQYLSYSFLVMILSMSVFWSGSRISSSSVVHSAAYWKFIWGTETVAIFAHRHVHKAKLWGYSVARKPLCSVYYCYSLVAASPHEGHLKLVQDNKNTGGQYVSSSGTGLKSSFFSFGIDQSHWNRLVSFARRWEEIWRKYFFLMKTTFYDRYSEELMKPEVMNAMQSRFTPRQASQIDRYN